MKLKSSNQLPNTQNNSIHRLYTCFIDLCATALWSGKIPGPQGTYGTAVAVGIILALHSYLPYLQTVLGGILLSTITTIYGIWCAQQALNLRLYENKSTREKHKNDPGQIVIDEVAGLFVTMIGLAPTALNLLIAFIFFRIFDILKPFPIRRIEKLHGGVGIMLDDVAAGIYAAIATRIALYFIH